MSNEAQLSVAFLVDIIEFRVFLKEGSLLIVERFNFVKTDALGGLPASGTAVLTIF